VLVPIYVCSRIQGDDNKKNESVED